MRVEEFDYELPAERIAQHPPRERGSSRLMVLDRERERWQHSDFRRLAQWLKPGDLLVLNDTRVIRARLRAERDGGAKMEVLLLRCERRDETGEVWSCLARPGARLRRGNCSKLPGGIVATWLDEGADDGTRRVLLRASRPIAELLEEIGEVPLPPYIRRSALEEDATAYQTVYARAPGAVAAPTAGLHFTREMLDRLAGLGVETATLTLHVGPGTFLPVRTERVEDHRMGAERVEIPEATARALAAAKQAGRRVIAVGTTTARALEGVPRILEPRQHVEDVDVFIRPGFRFRMIDGLVTNFHLPRSTLVMLVAALAGREFLLSAYREAIAEGYRFYSYGDAMMVL